MSTASIVARLAQELQRLGHDVAVLTSVPHYNPSADVRSNDRYRASLRRPILIENEAGLRVARCYVPQKPRYALRRVVDYLIFHTLMAIAVCRYFRDRQVTVVVSPPFTLAMVGMLARYLGGGRLVYNVQELWPDVLRDLGVIRNRIVLAALSRAEAWIYRSSDWVVSIGPGFARTIVSRGASADRSSVIPNFVDSERINPQHKVNPLAAAWGVIDKPVVLYAGNIGLTQDFDTLLRTAKMLEGSGVHFLIVGGGAARSRLEDLLRETRPINVEVRNFVPPEDVSDLYALADVVIVPLRSGHDRTTTPSKIFSAMAAQRPIVACASHDTDLASTIAQHRAGIVVPPGDAVQLADAIVTLVDGAPCGVWDPSAALEGARLHSPAAIAARYDAVLRSLVDASGDATAQGDVRAPK